MDGNVYTYKARLVAKGFIQTYDKNYGETFSPVADVRAIRIPLAILAFYDYEIWQMNVKITFLNGYLSEDQHMLLKNRSRHGFLPTAGDDQIILCFSTNPNMLFTAANGGLPVVVYKCLRLLHSVSFYKRNEDFVRRRDIGDPDHDVHVIETFHEQTDEEHIDKKEIWLRVQQMMNGFEIGDQEKKAKLFNEWERLIVVSGIANQNANQNGNVSVVTARAEGNLDGIEEVNANNILMANLQQASTSGTQTDKATVYDLDGSAEVHEYDNCYNNEIFNMFTQEEQYIELLEPIFEPHQVQQNDSNVISTLFSVQQSRGTVEQDPATIEETRAYSESLYNNLAIKVEKANTGQ
nr:putative retrotransposon Ty1-copia subclass protein [Tanacetum cinerariifolium]